MPQESHIRGTQPRARSVRRREWQPVVLLQIDVDQPEDAVALDLPARRRVWIEVVKRGQVIGLVEAETDDGGIPAATRADLRHVFRDVPTTAIETIDDDALPRATVVIPTVGRDVDLMNQAIEAVLSSDYPSFELVVVDNRDLEEAEPLGVKSVDERVRVVREPRAGAAAARNRGTAEARGEVVAFTDDDALVDERWLRALGARFVMSPEVQAVGGLVLPKELDTQPQLWFEEFYGGLNRSFRAEVVDRTSLPRDDRLAPYAPGRFGSGNNLAFRRDALEALGGFNEALGPGTPCKGGEDLEILFRFLTLGASLAIEPAAVVRHVNRRTRGEFVAQVLRYGTGLTAMYCAVLVRDSRHAPAIARRVPAGLRRLFRRRAQRSISATPSCPRRTYAYQVLGMTYGPVAYMTSVARRRRGR